MTEQTAKKFKLVFDKGACIGAFNCIYQDPRNWKQAAFDNRKVDLASALQNPQTKLFEKVVEEGKFDPKVVQSCPVQAIKIVELKESEK
jgi:ferredoxin